MDGHSERAQGLTLWLRFTCDDRDCRMTGSELARRCRVHENTVTNWRTGRSPVPGAVFAYLELLAKVKAIVA